MVKYPLGAPNFKEEYQLGNDFSTHLIIFDLTLAFCMSMRELPQHFFDFSFSRLPFGTVKNLQEYQLGDAFLTRLIIFDPDLGLLQVDATTPARRQHQLPRGGEEDLGQHPRQGRLRQSNSTVGKERDGYRATGCEIKRSKNRKRAKTTVPQQIYTLYIFGGFCKKRRTKKLCWDVFVRNFYADMAGFFFLNNR